MAKEGFLPGAKAMASIHPKYQTPLGATISQLVIAVIMMLLANPDRLSDVAMFTVLVFYALSLFAVFILRKNGGENKNLYRVPLYPITPIIAIIGAIYIICSTLISAPLDAVLSIGIAIIGIPVFVKLNSKKQKEELTKAS